MTELLRESIAQADREEFIEEEEMDSRIERMLDCRLPRSLRSVQGAGAVTPNPSPSSAEHRNR